MIEADEVKTVRIWLKKDLVKIVQLAKLADNLDLVLDKPQMTKYNEAVKIWDIVQDIFAVIPEQETRILELAYIDRLADMQILERLGFESTATFYRYKRRAISDFTELFILLPIGKQQVDKEFTARKMIRN
ncbi:RNA polymerase sigma factor [Weissella oryzae SG25]|uniref:RNA polymerase sigma factor n=1 Tax=Weissella oryzae (strain DSM 25784 / JCM 18191 / LMG 30913 / SG25) TaxID=1329250 RepID=A0A069CRQ9_WEIOS|nr:DUF1492 domain-containing protein [Weissella oryzae]GAK30465.1 RNA polymerase sigma factor [Weissella oryzae SG25]